uniref:(northern house mosquito) hypothetical protein n=1 Tax=Culex pipiens TaxID=7175 RepID=A0A8D8P2X4_CULPI
MTPTRRAQVVGLSVIFTHLPVRFPQVILETVNTLCVISFHNQDWFQFSLNLLFSLDMYTKTHVVLISLRNSLFICEFWSLFTQTTKKSFHFLIFYFFLATLLLVYLPKWYFFNFSQFSINKIFQTLHRE